MVRKHYYLQTNGGIELRFPVIGASFSRMTAMLLINSIATQNRYNPEIMRGHLFLRAQKKRNKK